MLTSMFSLQPYRFGTLISPWASLEAWDYFITWTVKYFSGLWFIWLKCNSSSVLFAFNQYYVSGTTSMSIPRHNSQTWLMSLLSYTSPFVCLSDILVYSPKLWTFLWSWISFYLPGVETAPHSWLLSSAVLHGPVQDLLSGLWQTPVLLRHPRGKDSFLIFPWSMSSSNISRSSTKNIIDLWSHWPASHDSSFSPMFLVTLVYFSVYWQYSAHYQGLINFTATQPVVLG